MTNQDIDTRAWNDATYMFGNTSQALPFDRSPKNGFRCVLLLEPEKVPTSAFEPLKLEEPPDFYKVQPVSDSVFQVFREQFSYDKTPLADSVEWSDMAGNVREWCWNETQKGRVIRGGNMLFEPTTTLY